jgi:hypothetical protein
MSDIIHFPPEWLKGTLFIDEERVNIDDLCSALARPGRIVRCVGNPNDAVKVIMPDDAPVKHEYIAGLASENP